jgi:ubiquinone biosynthesis monooxygenase Coq7
MNLLDRFICEIDNGLRTVFATAHAERALPSRDVPPAAELNPANKLDSAESVRLMRVNHAGEVSAQALYQGQALVAKSAQTRALLQDAAREERDHLAWCETRLDELGGSTSRLNPVFYAGSFALGVSSGLLGDKWSMGFLVETERQVEAHLDRHLARLPEGDGRSREILEAMREDEIHHAQTGLAHGGAELPLPVRSAMRAVSQLMTRSAYWV